MAQAFSHDFRSSSDVNCSLNPFRSETDLIRQIYRPQILTFKIDPE